MGQRSRVKWFINSNGSSGSRIRVRGFVTMTIHITRTAASCFGMGPFNKYVTPEGGGGVTWGVTKCDRGRGVTPVKFYNDVKFL